MKKTIILMMLMMMLVSAIGYAVTFDEGVIHDLTSTDSGDFIGSRDYQIALDSANNRVYIVGGDTTNYIARYDISTNITSLLFEGIPTGNSGKIMSVSYDSANNRLFYGTTGNNRIIAYNITSNDSYSILSFAGDELYFKNDVKYNPTDNRVYFINGYYDLNTNSANIFQSATSLGGESLYIDNARYSTYIVGDNGVFVKYDISANTTQDLSNGVIADSYLYSITYDSTNDIYYLGGTNSAFDSVKFFSFNPTTLTTTDLSNTDVGGFFSGISQFNYFVESLAYDNNSNLIYISGDNGLFAYYNISSNQIKDLSGLLTWGSFSNKDITTLQFDSANNGLFFGTNDYAGLGGEFGYYQKVQSVSTPETPTETTNQITGGAIYTLMSESGNGLGTFLSAITHPLGNFLGTIALFLVIVSAVLGIVISIERWGRKF